MLGAQALLLQAFRGMALVVEGACSGAGIGMLPAFRTAPSVAVLDTSPAPYRLGDENNTSIIPGYFPAMMTFFFVRSVKVPNRWIVQIFL